MTENVNTELCHGCGSSKNVSTMTPECDFCTEPYCIDCIDDKFKLCYHRKKGDARQACEACYLEKFRKCIACKQLKCDGCFVKTDKLNWKKCGWCRGGLCDECEDDLFTKKMYDWRWRNYHYARIYPTRCHHKSVCSECQTSEAHAGRCRPSKIRKLPPTFEPRRSARIRARKT